MFLISEKAGDDHSWLQILGNWILQELRRQTPPCMCLRNANIPSQLVKQQTDAAGVRVWSASVGNHGSNLFPSPLGAQIDTASFWEKRVGV